MLTLWWLLSLLLPDFLIFYDLGIIFHHFGDRYGVVAVRGAEVYEMADEEGNLLNDPATQKERVSLITSCHGNTSRVSQGWELTDFKAGDQMLQ